MCRMTHAHGAQSSCRWQWVSLLRILPGRRKSPWKELKVLDCQVRAAAQLPHTSVLTTQCMHCNMMIWRSFFSTTIIDMCNPCHQLCAWCVTRVCSRMYCLDCHAGNEGSGGAEPDSTWVARHPLKLRSAYSEVTGSEPPYTTCHSKFLGTVDYMWYTPNVSHRHRSLACHSHAVSRVSSGVTVHRCILCSSFVSIVLKFLFWPVQSGGHSGQSLSILSCSGQCYIMQS